LSNLRYKTISTKPDSLKVDSLSVAPGSFFIEGVDDSSYVFYPGRSLLKWKNKPAADSVHIRYRVLPISFHHVYTHKDPRGLVDSMLVSRVYRWEDKPAGNFLNYNQLEYNGSYGRAISLGNNQDVVVNSQFNLQANGYILDSVKLEAAITDNNVPFQPEGNTQRLQEFDQIYIRLMKKKHYLQIGDYALESPPGYFLKFFKRVQGLYYHTEFNLNNKTVNKLGVSGSVAKGQFSRNIFQGLEGNQGPYKLTGNNGEQFFIILAGTERVFVDNVIMERGENADYIINYNTGEIRFMPRKMITKDSRIQVEYEYQDRNYLNSLLYGYDEVQIGKKWNIRLNAYSNQDAKNQPYLQNLSGDQKRFLGEIGDSIQNAFYPNIALDTFAPNKILYKIVDTTVNGAVYDSVFVYSTHPDSARYSLSFSYVGPGRGDYIISSNNANGRVYDWVVPLNGVPQGSYAPVQLLVTPKKQQLFILTTNYQVDSLKTLSVEVGTSNTDPNLFSKADDQAHWGVATKVNYNELRFLGPVDTTGNKKWALTNQVSYEYVQDRFKAIAPYRNVEFGRDWNVPQTGPKPDEHLVYYTTSISNKKAGSLGYNFSYFQRGAEYSGIRNIVKYDYFWQRIRAGVTGNLLTATDTFKKSRFFRPSAYAEYFLKPFLRTYIGGTYSLEHNEIRNKTADVLLPSAFSFDIATAYLRTSEDEPFRWNLSYTRRRDRAVRANEFVQQNHSNNVDIKLGISKWKNHLLNFTGTYRQLILDDTLTGLKPEETLLGRFDYTGNLFHSAVSLNTLYEFGSGQEQKRAYTYVEVPVGQGNYTWIDYNGDGVQQLNEFEIALYPDQKKFIKLITPTNDYVRVNYVNYNFSVSFEPAYLWEGKEKTSFQKFVSRFSTQSALQISNRLLSDEGVRAYNPFIDVFNDNSIITTLSSLNNSIYFNRASSKWGIDYNILYNTGKQLLTYGVEGNKSQQHLYKLRWNITVPLSLNLQGRNGERAYQSALNDKRSYKVDNWAAEPSASWIFRSVLRITGGLRYEQRHNRVEFGNEDATIQGANLEIRYSKPTIGVFQVRGTYSDIEFNGKVTDPVAFVMLDALQKGSNYLWYLNWDRRVGKGVELSFEYEGRKPGEGNVIHTGRMSVRAIL
jgi:hypothetical protein